MMMSNLAENIDLLDNIYSNEFVDSLLEKLGLELSCKDEITDYIESAAASYNHMKKMKESSYIPSDAVRYMKQFTTNLKKAQQAYEQIIKDPYIERIMFNTNPFDI